MPPLADELWRTTMSQDTRRYSYQFPNAWFVFLVFLAPPIVYFLLLLAKFRSAAESQAHGTDLSLALISVFIAGLIAAALATIIANAFPDIRVNTHGIEVRFFFPLITLWIPLPWSSISKVSPQENPAMRLLGDRKPNLVVFSSALPEFYHLPTAWFAFSLRRGFIVTKQIQGYSELARVLQGTHEAT
jgi:hypothetical protein